MSPQGTQGAFPPLEGAIPPASPSLPPGAGETIAAGGSTFAALMVKVLQYLQRGLTDAVSYIEGLAQKIAAPIASGLTEVQAATADMGQRVRSGVAAAAAAATSSPGGTAAQGVVPGQYRWNLYAWSGSSTEKGQVWSRILMIDRGQISEMNQPWYCFLGGFDDQLTASAYAQDPGNLPPDGACPKPGGLTPPPVGVFPAPPPPPPPPPIFGAGPGCSPDAPYWAYWALVDPKSPGVAVNGSCVGPFCWDGQTVLQPPGPEPGWQLFGPFSSSDAVSNSIAVVCQGGQCETYAVYGDGKTPQSCTVTCDTGLSPSGYPVLIQGGLSQQSAQSLAAQCGGTTPPPPPPPPPGCMQVQLCGCTQIDLCDWSKFEDAVYNALCRWSKDCLCNLFNETAYTYKDCDEGLGKDMDQWMGKTAGGVAEAPSLDELVSRARDQWRGTLNGSGGR